MLQEEVDYLHSPEINLQIVFMVGTKQFLEQWSGRGPLNDRFQELRSRRGDGVIAQQGLAQRRRFVLSRWHDLIAGGTERPNNFLDQRGIVRRANRHRIARLE